MAGIGFELRKVVGKGGIGTFLQIAMSGAMIVAGPWILSIVTITLINTLLMQSFGNGMALFMGVMIYCYAFSLFLFGGFHYLFTRRMSDLLYIKKESQAFGYVLGLFAPVIIASTAIALPSALSFNPGIPHTALFRFSVVLFFSTVNCLWIIMLFVSVLKWYMKIMFVYAGGLASSLLFVYLLAKPFGTAGATLGFSLGHLMIVILLILLCRAAWKPVRPDKIDETTDPAKGRTNPVGEFIRYIIKHRYLFGAGTLYYWGIWADKIIFWITNGERIPGTFIKLFEQYDIPVYLANLTMIPGLIFFVIFSETEFYTVLKKFLHTISTGRFIDILSVKHKLTRVVKNSLKEQSLLQGTVTLVIIILAGGIIFRITLAAVFFHLLLLTLLNYLFYIEHYRHAFFSAMVFFVVNAGAALLTILPGTQLVPGFSYLLGASAGSCAAWIMLKRDISRLERHILTKY